MELLNARVVIITGAARGQGAAEMRACAELGATVIGTDIDIEAVEAAAASAGATAMPLDVSDDAAWIDLVDRAVTRFGRIDGLVNNAGIFSPETLLGGSVDTMRRIVDVNQIGTYLGMKRVAPAMAAGGGGSIVNISSIGGLRGVPAFAYAASKWAITGMTKSAARELGPLGIRVNSVHPGLVDTDMIRDTSTERRTELMAATPLGRMATVDDIAGPVAFLLGDASAHMTGAELIVDGGTIA